MATQKVTKPKAFPANMQAKAPHFTFAFEKWEMQISRQKRLRRKTNLLRLFFYLLRQRNL